MQICPRNKWRSTDSLKLDSCSTDSYLSRSNEARQILSIEVLFIGRVVSIFYRVELFCVPLILYFLLTFVAYIFLLWATMSCPCQYVTKRGRFRWNVRMKIKKYLVTKPLGAKDAVTSCWENKALGHFLHVFSMYNDL